jgi:hypothetical protein
MPDKKLIGCLKKKAQGPSAQSSYALEHPFFQADDAGHGCIQLCLFK